jgi:hypothetical protein
METTGLGWLVCYASVGAPERNSWAVVHAQSADEAYDQVLRTIGAEGSICAVPIDALSGPLRIQCGSLPIGTD